MKKFFSFFAAIALMVACTESSPEDGGDKPNSPQPQPEKSEISLDATSANFTTEGGEKKILFSTNEAWTAKVINTRADSWISIHPTSGGAGSATITVNTEPNDTPDDRSASIVIEAGSASKTVTVSQKQKDALTVTASTFEVGAEGGEVKIEVKANIDFEYAIDPADEEWISYESTRAMKTSTLTFSVAENDDTEKREGKIYIQSGEFNEEITIYQAGAEPSIVISQNEYVVAAAGETIAIDVTSNVDVTVELPSDVDWISENTTRATSTNTYRFDIQPNEDYDQRSAEIKFTNNESGLSEVVIVTQTQKDALVVAKDSYTVDSEGDQIEIEVGHNVDFDIEISADWIKKAQNTRAFVTDVLVFDIAANTSEDNREGTIVFTSKDGSLSQTVKVYQKQEGTIIVSTKEIVLEPESGTFTVEIQANVEFDASLDLVNWVRQIEPTRGLSTHTLYYEYDANPTAEPREAHIYVYNNDKEEIITITQKGAELQEDSYVLLGTGRWTDDVVASLFGRSIETYDVEVYENPAKPGFIYLKDLYTSAYRDVMKNAFGMSEEEINKFIVATESTYFAIDISDPTAVNIPNQSIGLDLGYGEMGIFNLEAGTLDNGILTFPTQGLAINLPTDGTYFANREGRTKLVMPGVEEVEDSYELIGTGRWTDDIVAPTFGLSAPTYEVEIYENPAKPGNIYLKDLYTNAYAGVLENTFGFDASSIPTWDTSYFAIDISDPTAVNIPNQSIGLDLGYGKMSVYSLETGTLQNDVLTFPSRGLAINLPSRGTYYANINGLTKLDMGSDEDGDEEEDEDKEEINYELLGTGRWTDDIIAPVFGIYPPSYEVEVYENPEKSGSIYLKDLYTNAYIDVLGMEFGIPSANAPMYFTSETTYIEIDISDPTAVNIPIQKTGLNLGYGEMVIWSESPGTMENGIITFPAESINMYDDDSAYIANGYEMTKLLMPGVTETYYESTDYSRDGEVKTLQTATKGKGIDIVLMGDAYSDRLIADGTYDKVMNTAMEKFFLEEPYKSYRDHFNVYSVKSVSANEVYTDETSTTFACFFGDGTYVGGNDQRVFSYAQKAIGEERIDDALIIVMLNSRKYAGTCWMYYNYTGDWGNGSSISYFPVGVDDDALAQVLHHEAGGHGFSKLADEYAYEHMGGIPRDEMTDRGKMMKYGWWKNVDFTSNLQRIKWSHFLSDERYAGEGLGAYEGGFTYWTGVWRPTENSIMRYNTGGFNAPSREAIYYRINKLAYGADWEYDYEEFVEYDAINRKSASGAVVPYRLDIPVDFTPLHPPVVVKSSWREAKNNAPVKTKAKPTYKDGKLQKVATPYRKVESAAMHSGKLILKGEMIKPIQREKLMVRGEKITTQVRR